MTADAAPLPAAWYLEADAFARERSGLFAECWQMLARAQALASPGDYVCNNLAGLAVFAMRGEDGVVRAFRNVCRHQKLPVLDAGAGRLAALRCRYHGWTYGFDGRFKEAPPKYAPGDPASPENGLEALPLAEWRSLLFVAPRPGLPPLGESTAPLERALAPLAPAALAGAGDVTSELQCNWKLAAEHLLAAPDAPLWLFPTAALEARGEALVVHQLVARTHERSRIISHVLAPDAAAAASALAALAPALAALKRDCEARQAALAAGAPLETAPARPDGDLAAFRARLRALHEGAA
jgi:nitrite reductase/ring-hydroxylating ferredoxin subunit